MAEKSLLDELAESLPKSSPFTVYHIATPPSPCEPIYQSLPGKNADKTYCESHFLNVAIRLSALPARDVRNNGSEADEILVMAIECLIYTTKQLTTIFVSKADSTGFLYLLQHAPGAYDSPLRSIASTFISHLARHRARPGIPCVVDLFARAANQYLFPGSVKNAKKHVSDDRQLIKWWLRVLDPIIHEYAPPKQGGLFAKMNGNGEPRKGKPTAQAYLLAPGEESIGSFLPRTTRLDPLRRARWTHGHPLRQLSRNPTAPPRCQIPIFPDDPKGRFCTELDSELPDGASQDGSPSKRGTGIWNSARTLEQFWDLMAFRAECSSGRLVGFIWVVIDTPKSIDEQHNDPQNGGHACSKLKDEELFGKRSLPSFSPSSTSPSSPQSQPQPTNLSTPRPKSRKPHNGRVVPKSQAVLSGPITPRLPRIKTRAPALSKLRSDSKYYLYETTRGNLILDQKSYERAVQVLHDLDFTGIDSSKKSTRAWVEQVSVLAGNGKSMGWGELLVGSHPSRVALAGDSASAAAANGAQHAGAGANVVNVLGIKRKRKPLQTDLDGIDASTSAPAEHVAKKARASESVESSTPAAGPTVNVLNGSFIRKKAKPVPHSQSSTATPKSGASAPSVPPVDTLDPVLIRKNNKRKNDDDFHDPYDDPGDNGKRYRLGDDDEPTVVPENNHKRKVFNAEEYIDNMASGIKKFKVSSGTHSPITTLSNGNGNSNTAATGIPMTKSLKRKMDALSDSQEMTLMDREPKVHVLE